MANITQWLTIRTRFLQQPLLKVVNKPTQQLYISVFPNKATQLKSIFIFEEIAPSVYLQQNEPSNPDSSISSYKNNNLFIKALFQSSKRFKNTWRNKIWLRILAIVSRKKNEKLPPSILLDFSNQHWSNGGMQAIFLKVTLWDHIPAPYKNWPVALRVPTKMAEKTLEAISFLLPTSTIYLIDPKTSPQFQSVLTLDSPWITSRSKFGNNESKFPCLLSSLEEWKRRLIELIDQENQGKKIFFESKALNIQRWHRAEEEITNSFGFQIINPSACSFHEIRKHFLHAEILIGGEDIDWSYMACCKPNTKIFIWRNLKKSPTNQLWATMAHVYKLALVFKEMPRNADSLLNTVSSLSVVGKSIGINE
jgi:hypothetical protein